MTSVLMTGPMRDMRLGAGPVACVLAPDPAELHPAVGVVDRQRRLVTLGVCHLGAEGNTFADRGIPYHHLALSDRQRLQFFPPS